MNSQRLDPYLSVGCEVNHSPGYPGNYIGDNLYVGESKSLYQAALEAWK